MLGYDPDSDLLVLGRADRNRRTNVLEPEKSLLLRKPLMQVSHGGGQKLLKTDAAYELLTRWIEEGCRADPDKAPRLSRLEVYPEVGRIVRRPAHTQQLSVLAHFSDGSVRDVTRLATYTTSDDQVATTTPEGVIIGKGRGTVAISVRYLAEVVSRHFTFVEDVTGFVWNNPKSNNYVDDRIHEQLKLLNYLPADICGDEEFVRRVYLDVIGLLPAVEETRRFLDDRATDKRSKLIDALLQRPEYAKYWGQKTADLLRVTPKRLTDKGAKLYNEWIVKAVADNMPYDQFVTAPVDRQRRHVRESAGQLLPQLPRKRRPSPRRRRSCSWACACSAASATTTRSSAGRKTITMASPQSSTACSARERLQRRGAKSLRRLVR